VLRTLKKEGKVRFVGISTPEHDQNSVISLMRGGWVDVVQVIYNIFEQEPAAELLPAAAATGTGIIVRVVFDEGSLTGKWTRDTVFPEGDFRRSYFEGDRLGRAVDRAAKVADTVKGSGYSLPQAAIKFALSHSAVGTVIPGMRSAGQAEANCSVSDMPAMTPELQRALRAHNWRRAFWYGGK
jgi:aryl-alcohol dehydrogenase-like predicted oxidoreductase